MNILISCLNFNSYTGSELHFYELAKELVKQGCNVTICAKKAKGDLTQRAISLGIKVCDINEMISLKSQNAAPNFDILHLSHKPMVEHLMKLYPDVPVISTIHSEIISVEHPVINDRIKKYIAIRPEIKEFMINRFNISEDKIEVIYNPIDDSRFKIGEPALNHKKIMLFVGTMDRLRENTIKDLIEDTKERGYELHLVGKRKTIDIDKILTENDHVKYFPPTWYVEKHIQDCDMCASILLGRTLIEGWLCGKTGIQYNVDANGSILSKQIITPPTNLDVFKSSFVTNQIIMLYKSIL